VSKIRAWQRWLIRMGLARYAHLPPPHIEVYFMSQTKTVTLLVGQVLFVPLVFSSNAPADRTLLGLACSAGVQSQITAALSPDNSGIIVTAFAAGTASIAVAAAVPYNGLAVDGDTSTVIVNVPQPITVAIDTTDAVPYTGQGALPATAPAPTPAVAPTAA
jgi:hypothetical protein